MLFRNILVKHVLHRHFCHKLTCCSLIIHECWHTVNQALPTKLGTWNLVQALIGRVHKIVVIFGDFQCLSLSGLIHESGFCNQCGIVTQLTRINFLNLSKKNEFDTIISSLSVAFFVVARKIAIKVHFFSML